MERNHETETLKAQVQELRQEISRLRDLAERDGLTGCLRRETFFSLITQRKQFGSLPKNLTLVIADIDHFKKINDEHGHNSGDIALKAFACTLQNALPEGSLLCRMGGEEFVAVIPGSVEDNEGALEYLRRATAATLVKSDKGRRIPLTASFGAVTWDSDTEILSACASADLLLYQAKRGGRNRVAAA